MSTEEKNELLNTLMNASEIASKFIETQEFELLPLDDKVDILAKLMKVSHVGMKHSEQLIHDKAVDDLIKNINPN